MKPLPLDHAALQISRPTPVPITVAMGDGIGPEIMQATLEVLAAAGAALAPEPIEIGARQYAQGHSSGIAPDSWESLRRTKVFLKGPITTPSGGGFKSLNVTIRKTLGLFANVRPCRAYAPFVPTLHPTMDVVIVRENEEDLYAGIEHRQTDEVFQCLKLITRPGCERIVRYAFEYARAHARRKVTCMIKDNIMKMTDGLFYQVFEEIGVEYPDIQQDRQIIDIGAAHLAVRPEKYDVIVTPNLYGDIISDVAAELTGSVGLAGSANIGEHVAMFEAIHGSAPDLAGRGVANPSGVLQAAVSMLVHIGQHEVAQRVQNAWLCALEDGQHTQDISSDRTTRVLGTQGFAEAIIERLGRQPQHLPPAHFQVTSREPSRSPSASARRLAATKALVGVDAFVHEGSDRNPEVLAQRLRAAAEGQVLNLQMITNRGVKVWPDGFAETFCTDHWRCRFLPAEGVTLHGRDVVNLLAALVDANVDVIKTENLCTFDGERGYALAQGQ